MGEGRRRRRGDVRGKGGRREDEGRGHSTHRRTHSIDVGNCVKLLLLKVVFTVCVFVHL